jgi:hypothetical protein
MHDTRFTNFNLASSSVHAYVYRIINISVDAYLNIIQAWTLEWAEDAIFLVLTLTSCFSPLFPRQFKRPRLNLQQVSVHAYVYPIINISVDAYLSIIQAWTLEWAEEAIFLVLTLTSCFPTPLF